MIPSEIPFSDGARDLSARYRYWLCDVWGVLHNGVAAFPGAIDALVRHRAGGGRVILITNAPRPAASVAAQLAGFGVPADAFDDIVTSGDVTRDLIVQARETPLARLGPDRDQALYDGLDLEFVPLEEATTIVCTGLIDDTNETPEDYDPALGAAVARGATMICANPDLVVQRGESMVYCAGALAQRFSAAGGTVLYAGKPYPPIYDLCIRRLAALAGEPPEKAEILAIGDGLPTDIAGAESYGLDCLYVADGIHRSDIVGADGAADPARLAKLFANAKRPPVAAVFGLSW